MQAERIRPTHPLPRYQHADDLVVGLQMQDGVVFLVAEAQVIPPVQDHAVRRRLVCGLELFITPFEAVFIRPVFLLVRQTNAFSVNLL